MIYVGDCLEVMRALEANSVDALVTDPPYGIRFMGKAWDGADIEARHAQNARKNTVREDGYERTDGAAFAAGSYNLSPVGMRAFQEFSRQWGTEAMRVMKPGAHLVSFASPRTYHRMVCGLEEAGFEIRDTLMWLFGSGFPKSHNLRGDMEGWGTALKPAHEPIVLARKPLAGTVATNVQTHGTGALNIDRCRVLGEAMPPNTGAGGLPRRADDEQRGPGVLSQPHDLGRWPANVLHDGSEEVVSLFPETRARGNISEEHQGSTAGQNVYGKYARRAMPANPADAGGAARFFCCAKVSKKDRNDGCDALPLRPSGMVSNTSGQHMTRRDGGAPGPTANNHPTVKPTNLMRWLCRLVTPPGGLVLDPFTGSGSTGRAAIAEGMRFVGIELDPTYAAIADARIRAMQPGLTFGEAA